jgi:hypothetical protein
VNPFVFIVGCPRSGTTLLQRMIDAHPEVTITPSMHWITGYFRKQGIRRPEDLVGLESVSGVLENPRFARFEIPREAVQKLFHSGEPLTYSEFLAALFDLHRRAKDKPLVGNKTAPAYDTFSSCTLCGLTPRSSTLSATDAMCACPS